MLSYVSLNGGWALTADDTLVQVHNMFDGSGEPTSDPKDAVAFTAGNGSAIYAFSVSEIPRRTIH
jgi:hypothetical protein